MKNLLRGVVVVMVGVVLALLFHHRPAAPAPAAAIPIIRKSEPPMQVPKHVRKVPATYAGRHFHLPSTRRSP